MRIAGPLATGRGQLPPPQQHIMSPRVFLRRPLVSPFFASLRQPPSLRKKSTASIVQAVANVRQLAQPVAFIAVKGWDKEGVACVRMSLSRLAGEEGCVG